MPIVIKDENNYKIDFFFLEPCDIWYERLRHLNYNYIKRLFNLKLLPTIIFLTKNDKCEICVELIKIHKDLYYNSYFDP